MNFIKKGEYILSGIVGLLIVNYLLPGGFFHQVSRLFESPPPFVEGRGLSKTQIQNIKKHDSLIGLGVVKHFNEINWNRHFRVSYYVPLKILVDENGNQFTQDKVFEMLRSYGKQRAEFECKLLLQSIANVCEVNKATAKLETFGKDKKRFVNLSMELFFIQKTDFGVLPEDVAMVFKELDNTILNRPGFAGGSYSI